MRKRPIILCYHRIAEPSTSDINNLAVSPKKFRGQLELLKKHYRFKPLTELIDNYEPDTISLTFDDGYRDNLVIAAEILDHLSIPADFFLATRFIDQNIEFYTTSLATVWLEFSANRNSPRLTRSTEIEYFLHQSDSYWDVLKKISSLDVSSLWSLTVELDQVARDIKTPDLLESPLTKRDVEELTSNQLFSVGPHTATHPRMSAISVAEAEQDFTESLDALKNWGQLKNKIYFPYPFGQKADYTEKLTDGLSSKFAVRTMSTLPQSISKTDLEGGHSTLPRLSVQNWEPAKLLAITRISQFFSYVPIAMSAGLRTTKVLRNLRN